MLNKKTAKSMRAVFQLSPLSEASSKDPDIPKEAVKCSSIAMAILKERASVPGRLVMVFFF
jgi:hypothetical protein